MAHDVVQDFAEDGVVYLELRSTPRANEASGTGLHSVTCDDMFLAGMTKVSYVDAVLAGIESALKSIPSKICVRQIQ